MNEHVIDINRLILGLSEIPSSDPLVNVAGTAKDVQLLPETFASEAPFFPDAGWSALIRKATAYRREYALDTLCLASGTLDWEYKGKPVRSPLLLQPVDWKLQRSGGLLSIQPKEGTVFINPFVRYRLQREWSFELPDFSGTLQEILPLLEELLISNSLKLTISPLSAVGHFHHHRFYVLRELENIAAVEDPGPLVARILGNEAAQDSRIMGLPSGLLFPADTDQLNVFDTVNRENCVVQGPPGTGKSQVLANMLGKMLSGEGMTLVVSEKRAALEVLMQKLKASGLDQWVFLTDSGTSSGELIAHLRRTWELQEQESPGRTPFLQLSEQLIDGLQLLLDRLNHPDLAGGLSYPEFRKWLDEVPAEGAEFRSDTLTAAEWKNLRSHVEQLEQIPGMPEYLGFFRPALFRHTHPDRVLRELLEEAVYFYTHYGASDWEGMLDLQRSSARARLISNELFKYYTELRNRKGGGKKLRAAAIRYKELIQLEAHAAEEQSIWKYPLSRTEAESYLEQFARVGGWSSRRKWKKLWASLVTDPALNAEIALKNWLRFLELSEEKIALESRFRKWGIDRPETELDSALYVLSRLESEDGNELNRIALLPAGNRRQLEDDSTRIAHFIRDWERNLAPEAFAGLKSPGDAAAFVTGFTRALPQLRTLPEKCFQLAKTCRSFREMEATVLYSNLRLLEMQFLDMANFSGDVLLQKINTIVQTEMDDFASYAFDLNRLRKKRFDHYNEILRTPPARLKGPEKLFRARLKSGKALLVREFGKTKQHPTIRELLDSDARLWIDLLAPLWLSTPSQVARTFPMERNLFRLVIFDEASQIPLPNALGALFRSESAIVAGDEQQMAPSAYFSGSRTDVDLLHQASWYWKKVPLQHHYRSEHPALIAFSNRHFYRNELVVYPSPSDRFPLHLHAVNSGTYIDRRNREEARVLAEWLENFSWKNTLGVVAFSEQQLECIWQSCSERVRERIAEGQEEGTVFFKALEQIQGDEADILLISLGYARNADGAFHLRFGPLNQAGGHKRLNVLLTRARSEMHWFASVFSADFPVSANESVNLLRLFLKELEAGASEYRREFPFALEPSRIDGKNIHFPEGYSRITDARELIVFHRVMTLRGWNVTY